MPGKSPIGHSSSYRKSVVNAQTVEMHLGVQATTTQDIRVDDALTIPEQSLVLIRGLDNGTDKMTSSILNYEIRVCKKLPDTDLPEGKRNIKPGPAHMLSLANPLHHTYIRRMPRALKIGHCTIEDVQAYLQENPLPENSCAFILSNSKTKLFYVDQTGKVQELASIRDTGMVASFVAQVQANLINEDIPMSFAAAMEAHALFEHKNLFPFIVKEQYQLVGEDEPVFPNDDSPSIDEIQQRYIPDCFLLAALQSILNHEDGKAFIREMIVDHHDGWVSVKLFDPETKAPLMVKIRKAILVENGKPLNGHTGLWVHLIEAAYAAMGQKHDKQVGPSQAAVFSGGGFAHFALQILTGKESEYVFTKLPSKKVPVFMDKKILEGTLKVYSDAKGMGLPEEQASQFMGNQFQFQFDNIVLSASGLEWVADNARPDEMSDETIEALHQYFHYYKQNKEECDRILDNDRLSVEEKIDALHDLFKSRNAPGSLCALFVSTKQVLSPEELEQRPLIAFSGEYSQATRELYNKIKDNLGSKNQLTTGTRSKDGYKKAELEILPGIAGTHAYSIHQAYARIEIINGVPKEILYVQVRNPWGTMGMSYKPNQSGEIIPKKEDNQPLFEIELNDFIKMMQGISIMESGNLFSFSHEVEKLAKNIREGNLIFSDKREMSQLLKNKKILDDFFKMELKHLEYLSPEVKEKIQDILNTEEYDHHTKKDKILIVLKEANINLPFYHGRHEHQHFYLVNLVMFLEESKKQNPDVEFVLSLRHKVLGLSGYSFSTDLIESQLSFEEMILRKKDQFIIDIANLESALQKLEQLFGKMNDSDDFYQKDRNELVIHNRAAIQVLRENMKETEIFLANMGAPLNEAEKSKLRALDEEIARYSLGNIDKKIDDFNQNLTAIEINLQRLSSEFPEDVLAASFKSIDKALVQQQIKLEEIQEIEDPRILGMERRLTTLRDSFEKKKTALSSNGPAQSFNGQNSHSRVRFWARSQEGFDLSALFSPKKGPGYR